MTTNFPQWSGTLRFAWWAGLLLLAGCISSPRFTTGSTSSPAHVSSRTATAPPAGKSVTTEGLASYYAHDFNGKTTANGEVYDMYRMTAAHRSLPFGTKVKVTNLDNNRSIVVRINDRGPFKLERLIDLSLAAATQLEMTKTGTARVRLEVQEWGDDEYVK